MKVEYTIYERRSGNGPAFLCRPLVEDRERLIFSGATAEAAEGAAREWFEKNFVPKPSPVRKTTETVDLFG